MFDALERGRKIEDHEGWKIRLSLFFSPSLSLSLEYLKKFKKFKEKEQEKRRKRKKKSGTSWILHITKDSLPSQKKNCTLSTVRASHISTPILYANPNPNLTRPTQRIVWQRRVPSQTRGISLFQNSSRPLFRPTNGRIIVSRIHTHMHRFEKFEIRSWREETNPSVVWETSRGGKSKGAW